MEIYLDLLCEKFELEYVLTISMAVAWLRIQTIAGGMIGLEQGDAPFGFINCTSLMSAECARVKVLVRRISFDLHFTSLYTGIA